MKKTKKEKTNSWMIHGVPKNVQNIFCAEAKKRGLNVGEFMEYVICKEFRITGEGHAN